MTIGRLRAVTRNNQVDQLAKQAAEVALRLAALPADGLRNNLEALDSIEHLAMRILREVSAVRAGKAYAVGETSGMWPAMQPLRRQ
jgi:surfactin synthase thioesterase subunit